MEDGVGVGLTDSTCVTVDLGGADTGVEGTLLGGWLAEGLDVVDGVVDDDVEDWLVLVALDIRVEELDVCGEVRHWNRTKKR